MGARILIVDDESQMRRVLARTLGAQGFEVRAVATGGEALSALRWHPDLILLDLMLPDLDGLDVTKRIREQGGVPILVLSARGDEQQKVAALDLGADDYITKPFGAEELLARIRVALRHTAQTSVPIIEAGELRIDLERRLVSRRGEDIHLTPTEYEVLKYLARHAGKVITHRTLLQEVWGPEHLEETQYLHVLISQLRRKIEPQVARPQYVLTEPGVGYRFRPPA
ncbi:MAG TPA: response regulator transcription factor [bacterium]|jgi:two-component system KDP operon response regulator KdpE|nr:response regulator transcription factor [bacterium]